LAFAGDNSDILAPCRVFSGSGYWMMLDNWYWWAAARVCSGGMSLQRLKLKRFQSYIIKMQEKVKKKHRRKKCVMFYALIVKVVYLEFSV